MPLKKLLKYLVAGIMRQKGGIISKKCEDPFLKKIFKLEVENKNAERQLESVKNEIRKYMKRERKKKLPEDALYWDFDCRFGQNADAAENCSASELITALEKAHQEAWKECYVEILCKAVAKKEPVSLDEDVSE